VLSVWGREGLVIMGVEVARGIPEEGREVVGGGVGLTPWIAPVGVVVIFMGNRG